MSWLKTLRKRLIGRFLRPPEPRDTFDHGYQAGIHDELRSYAEEIGPNAVEGWDAYWKDFGPDY